MHIVELDVFAAAHGALSWPWIAIDPAHTRLAFAASEREIATRALEGGRAAAGPSFALPADLALPMADAEEGLRAFALSPDGGCLALIGTAAAASLVVTVDAAGEVKRTPLAELANLAELAGVTELAGVAVLAARADGGGPRLSARAVSFDRSGTRLWISADGASESALLLVDARTHEVFAVLRYARFPPPAVHELHVHPSDDAVLLLASCGEDGTFARVAGWTGGDPRSAALIPTALDAGDAPAGFVGFSADHAYLHLAEAEALRTHAWPGLVELASIPLDADMVSSFAGVVLGHRVLVDGAIEGDEVDTVMAFDRTGLRGTRVKPPLPEGMWVGRFGSDGLVTIASQGEPATARIVRLPAPAN